METIDVSIPVDRVCVLLTNGMDVIQIHTNIPISWDQRLFPNKLILEVKVPHGKGAEFVRSTFSIEPEILDVSWK